MEDKTLAKLKQYIELVNGSVTKEDFNKFTKQALEFLLRIEQKNREALDRLEKTYAGLLKFVSEKYDMTLSDLKGQVDHVFVGKQLDAMKQEHSQRMSAIDAKLPTIKSIKNIYINDKGELIIILE